VEKISKRNAKISPENFSPLLRNRRKPKWFHSVMTSMTMLLLKDKIHLTLYGF